MKNLEMKSYTHAEAVDLLAAARAAYEKAAAEEAAISAEHSAAVNAAFCAKVGKAADLDAISAAADAAIGKYAAATNKTARAALIQSAAVEIERRTREAEAVAAVLEIINKYAGKKAGPKTRRKVADEIAAAVGAERSFFCSNYYSGSFSNEIKLDFPGCHCYNDFPALTANARLPFITESNFFFRDPQIDLPRTEYPADLDAWATQFYAARAEIAAAAQEFNAKADAARALTIGKAGFPTYRATKLH